MSNNLKYEEIEEYNEKYAAIEKIVEDAINYARDLILTSYLHSDKEKILDEFISLEEKLSKDIENKDLSLKYAICSYIIDNHPYKNMMHHIRGIPTSTKKLKIDKIYKVKAMQLAQKGKELALSIMNVMRDSDFLKKPDPNDFGYDDFICDCFIELVPEFEKLDHKYAKKRQKNN